MQDNIRKTLFITADTTNYPHRKREYPLFRCRTEIARKELSLKELHNQFIKEENFTVVKRRFHCLCLLLRLGTIRLMTYPHFQQEVSFRATSNHLLSNETNRKMTPFKANYYKIFRPGSCTG